MKNIGEFSGEMSAEWTISRKRTRHKQQQDQAEEQDRRQERGIKWQPYNSRQGGDSIRLLPPFRKSGKSCTYTSTNSQTQITFFLKSPTVDRRRLLISHAWNDEQINNSKCPSFWTWPWVGQGHTDMNPSCTCRMRGVKVMRLTFSQLSILLSKFICLCSLHTKHSLKCTILVNSLEQ